MQDNIDDNGLHVGPTLDSLEEGIFVEQTDAALTDAQTPEPEAPKPEEKLLAGKYKTVEELEKAYAEAQKLIGKKPEDKPADAKAPEEKPAEDGDKPPEEAPEGTTAPVLDFAKLSAEWDENGGKLTEETQAGLTKLGVTPEVTGLFYAGIEAIVASRASTVQALAGTTEEYNSLIAWGSKNLGADEMEAFNGALDRALYEGDTAAIKLMIPAVRAKMAGDAPSYVQSRLDGGVGSIKAFANQAEQNEAINDRRYGRDPAYTREVEQRIGLSTF
jgi:hypothetical protein